MVDVFAEIGILIALATAGGIVAHMLRQPLIPVYILIGILLGPVTGILTPSPVIGGLGLAGVAFLLFIVGLELDVRKLADIGAVSTVGGVLQVGLTGLVGFLIMLALGRPPLEGIYAGLILAFSSTMVVVKILSDHKNLSTLHGKITMGILLMQDVLAIFALSVLSSGEMQSLSGMGLSLLKAALLLAGVYLISRFLFPWLFGRVARMPELLFMTAISVCFVFSILFNLIGFSIAIGAFVAGVSLASLPYGPEIVGRVKSLRDFFATLFFVSLGTMFSTDGIGKLLLPLAGIVLLVLIVKPFLVTFICALFGYTRRTSFLTALSLAQISEFSLILAAQGAANGHLSAQMYGLVVLAAIVTIATTSYSLAHHRWLWERMQWLLRPFDLMAKGRELGYTACSAEGALSYDALLIGYDRLGYDILKHMEETKKECLVIDFNPDIIRRLKEKRRPCLYGDVGDPEILERVDAKSLSIVISTVPTVEDNIHIIESIRTRNKKVPIFVAAESIDDALKLYQRGADYVILTHFLGGKHVGLLIDKFGEDMRLIAKNKLIHIHELKTRKALQHEHPRKHG